MQERELQQLQAALQALGGPADGSSHIPAAGTQHQHVDTGVFGAVNHSNITRPWPDNNMSSQSQCKAPHSELFDSSCAPNVTAFHDKELPSSAKEPHSFQYPEGMCSPVDTVRSVAQQRYMATTARCSAQQPVNRQEPVQQHNTQGQRYNQPVAHNQAAQYTVQEPDSPCQTDRQPGPSRGFQTASARLAHTNEVSSHSNSCSEDADLPAGCLYQDTTIRRTTTPLKSGNRSTAWAHEEFITVRQIREVKQSEARNVSWLEHGRPYVAQGGTLASWHLQLTANIKYRVTLCWLLRPE